MKRTWLLVFYLLAGIVVGGLLAGLCADIGALSWLAYGTSVGFNPETPFVLDFAILRVSFGFSLSITVAQILTIGLAIFLYAKTRIK